MIRVVLDTNVLVSGLLSPTGHEALALLAVNHGLIWPCLSEDILAEYSGVLSRAKFGFAQEQIAALMATLRRKGEVFRPEGSRTTSPDPADTKFLHCAEAAGAEFIVTGNKRDFPGSPYGAIRVVNAGELIDRITLGL